MRYASIRSMDISNGANIGISVFIQGCPAPHCKGCFNPETWDFCGGKEWTKEIEDNFFELATKPYIKRISFLGGECLADRNVDDVTTLVKKCREKFPKKEIWLWTRYDYETYVSNLEVTKYVDYIIDGMFIQDLKDISLKYRGSTNQRIIDVKKTLKAGNIVTRND